MPQGLNTTQAQANLQKYGFNELPSAKSKNIFQIALEVIKEPMFLLLISCGVLYMTLGDYKEGIILLSSIFIIIFITFYQYQKTEKALDALNQLSSPRALVIRDGQEVRIASREVVPDDIIILNEGDRVVADAQVVNAINLKIDEALLTGESLAVNKQSREDSDAINNNDLVFSGTLVVQGKGFAKVVTTGIHTQFGKIGTSLLSIKEEETRLQKEMKILIRNLFIIGGFVSVGVVLAFYLTRGNFLQSLLSRLASAMAILPEEFPVVLTVFMALGAWRLSKKKVLTRKPSAIETLGSATVLCTDKTGTITQNKMEIAVLYDGNEVFSTPLFNDKQIEIRDLILNAHYASQQDSIDPMEKAISKTHNDFFIHNANNFNLLKEYPLSRELLAMTRVLENVEEKEVSVSTKGAPEAIFALCKMSDLEKNKHLAIVQQMAEQGYRVIAVAKAIQENTALPQKQHEFPFEFLGLIGLEDPIRPEVPQAIQECMEAGIKVMMITGDYPATALSIGNQIGLDATQKIMTGNELKMMTDDELSQKIEGINIFARVVPEQKLRIVQALKANNEIVAMTGDGVNDAPALKAANIGIAMGNKGTDVAREAASLVLLDDNFASIVGAIRSGRAIFDNLQKAMSYILAIHIPIIGLSFLPVFFTSLPILLMPLHIVFMELIIDPVCSVAFEYEQEEKGIMQRLPRDSNKPFFGSDKIIWSLLRGGLLLIMVLAVYFLSLKEGHTAAEVRAIAFSTLIIGNIFLILTSLSKSRSFFSVFRERNYPVMFILTLTIVILLLAISIPGLQHIFSFEFPGYQHFIPAFLGAFALLFILETVKNVTNLWKAKAEKVEEK
ncbi:MAG: cation-translocating P-type ATPase [Bacteroidia bacterium]